MNDLYKVYYALRDELYRKASPEMSKKELHRFAKALIFPLLAHDSDNFNDRIMGEDEPKGDLSLTWLTEDGMRGFIEGFKLFAQKYYNVEL